MMPYSKEVFEDVLNWVADQVVGEPSDTNFSDFIPKLSYEQFLKDMEEYEIMETTRHYEND